ncbi:MAG TPA: DUF484 family protein [Stellaceae bacterium]|nr:DUF484 family protein [Stellaceae bacterium]
MDRSKDPSIAALEERPAAPLSAADVEAHLRLHPDFLIEHPGLLGVLTPPPLYQGEQIADFGQCMVAHQRAEIARLKQQQRLLLALSRTNLASQARVHASVLALISAPSFEQLIQACTTDLAALLDADVVTLAVERSGPYRPHLGTQGVMLLEPGTIDALLGAEREILLLDDTPGDPILFGDGAGLVRSSALLRLMISNEAPAGLLCIGTRRSNKFHAGQGTELLSFLAQALGVTIAQWLDLPV